MTLRTRTRRPRSISKEERPTRSLSNFPRLKPMRFSFHLIFLGSKIRLQDQVVRKIKYFQPAPPHHLVFPACPTSSRSVSPFLSTSPLWSSTSPALCTLLPRIFPWSPITWMLEALSRDQNSISSVFSSYFIWFRVLWFQPSCTFSSVWRKVPACCRCWSPPGTTPGTPSTGCSPDIQTHSGLFSGSGNPHFLIFQTPHDLVSGHRTLRRNSQPSPTSFWSLGLHYLIISQPSYLQKKKICFRLRTILCWN